MPELSWVLRVAFDEKAPRCLGALAWIRYCQLQHIIPSCPVFRSALDDGVSDRSTELFPLLLLPWAGLRDNSEELSDLHQIARVRASCGRLGAFSAEDCERFKSLTGSEMSSK